MDGKNADSLIVFLAIAAAFAGLVVGLALGRPSRDEAELVSVLRKRLESYKRSSEDIEQALLVVAERLPPAVRSRVLEILARGAERDGIGGSETFDDLGDIDPEVGGDDEQDPSV